MDNILTYNNSDADALVRAIELNPEDWCAYFALADCLTEDYTNPHSDDARAYSYLASHQEPFMFLSFRRSDGSFHKWWGVNASKSSRYDLFLPGALSADFEDTLQYAAWRLAEYLRKIEECDKALKCTSSTTDNGRRRHSYEWLPTPH